MNPRARLFHYEKSSRSHIPVDDVDIELSLLYYQPYLDEGDPYFNRNLSRNVTHPALANGETPRHATFREQYRARRDSATGVREPALRRPAPSHGTRKLPDDEVVAYDVSSHILHENYSLMQRFYRFPYLDLDHVLWFVPHFDHLYRGGIFTIFRAAAYFSQRAGTRNTIVLYGKRQISSDQIELEVRQAFPGLRFEFQEYSPKHDIDELPNRTLHFVRCGHLPTIWSDITSARPSFRFCRTTSPRSIPPALCSALSKKRIGLGLSVSPTRPALLKSTDGIRHGCITSCPRWTSPSIIRVRTMKIPKNPSGLSSMADQTGRKTHFVSESKRCVGSRSITAIGWRLYPSALILRQPVRLGWRHREQGCLG